MSLKIGNHYIHPEHGLIEILDGQFMGQHGVSNFWTWKVVATGEMREGYGGDWQAVKVAPRSSVLTAAFNAVRSFHRAFGQPAPDQPAALSPERVAARADWSAEEVQEFRDAKTLTEQVDSAIDRIYFALGDLVEMGIDPSTIFDLVQNANMAKLWADGKPRFREDGKIIKPEGWIAPDAAIEAEIERLLSQDL